MNRSRAQLPVLTCCSGTPWVERSDCEPCGGHRCACGRAALTWGIAMPPRKALQSRPGLSDAKDRFARSAPRQHQWKPMARPLENIDRRPRRLGVHETPARGCARLRLEVRVIHWLREAITECRWLLSRTPRNLPILTEWGPTRPSCPSPLSVSACHFGRKASFWKSQALSMNYLQLRDTRLF